jgi:PAS domain-containing protein
MAGGESTERLRGCRALFEGASVGIVRIDDAGRTQEANGFALRLLGHALGRARGS